MSLSANGFPPQPFVFSLWGEGIGSVGKAIKEITSFTSIGESLQLLPDKLRPAIRSLAGRGWFISANMKMSLLRRLGRLADAENLQEIDALMAQWVESEIDYIFETAIDRFPSRKEILAAAFSAHKGGTYELSIPVFLIQVEGMCIEKLERKLFATKKGIPRTRDAVIPLIRGAFSEVFLLPLLEANGVTASEDTRCNWPAAPNRHEILHGLSSDYQSILNSQKAISLLAYFVTMVARDSTTFQSASSSDPQHG